MSELLPIQESILEEVSTARKSVKTDDYSMSIGELINLYRDEEIKLDPAFQRLFRWEDHQKTKLIESVLIGIPIPEIFVAQKSDGTWHVVDGVQRLSTIFQLVGVLRKSDPLTLTSCKYIPSLNGVKWVDLPITTQREFKKSKIKVNIILTQNSDEAQYELFQRLNTGGTSLTDQEVRNCLILMVDPEFYKRINELKEYPNFLDCLKLKAHNYDKELHMELIIRMYMGFQGIINYTDYEPISNTQMSEFIDKETINLIKNGDLDNFIEVFKRTFDKLKNCLGDKSFKKYDTQRDDFVGAFSVAVFEMISTGIAANIEKIENQGNQEVVDSIKQMYSDDTVKELLDRGVKVIKRFKGLTAFSKDYFA